MFNRESARAAVQALSGKWTLVVLAELAEGPKGYNRLAEATGLDNKTLSRSLLRMEQLGLIERAVCEGRPPRVYYRITSHAQPLLQLLEELGQWWSWDDERNLFALPEGRERGTQVGLPLLEVTE